MFKVGEATITRIEETYGPCYPLREIFPEFNDAHMAEHKRWLAPHHYDADSGLIRLRVHSWLLKVGGKKILIDSCCGNNKIKPGRPWWNMLNDQLSRAACRRRRAAGGHRSGDVHASASRSCRLEHAAEGRQMGADLSQRALRLQQARHRLLLQDRRRPERGAGRTRHLPRMRDADPRIRQGRCDRGRSTASTTSSRSTPRPAIRPATSSSSSRAKASAPPSSATSGITCCRSTIRTGISRRTPTRRRRKR